jgi:MFS family permease
VDALGWRDAWRILAVCAFAIILPLSFLMRRAPEDHGLHPDGKSAAQVAAGLGRAAALDFANSLTRSQALRTSSFYLVAIAFGLGILSVQVILIQAIAYMTSTGHSETFGAFMITMTSIPATFLKPVWGYVLDKADVQRVSLLGFLCNAIGLFVIVFAVRAGVAPGIALGFFILGIGWSGFIPIQEVIWATFFGRRYLGAVRSAGLPLVFAFSAGGPLLAAFYYDRYGNYDGAFLTIAVLTLVGGVLLAVARRPVRTVEV